MDWQHITLPPILCANTLVLLASSVTLEIARRRIAAYARGFDSLAAASLPWLVITLTLGLLFVAGQCIAWMQLKAAGRYLATNPNSSFFCVFTGVHAAHVVGRSVGTGLRHGQTQPLHPASEYVCCGRAVLAFHGHSLAVSALGALGQALMATNPKTMLPSPTNPFTSKLRDYCTLTKPEVNLLILMTTSAGYYLASRGTYGLPAY